MKTRIRVSLMALAAAVASVVATPSHAADANSIATVITIASATVGGTPLVNFSLDLRNVSNPLVDTNPTEINWANVTSGQGWTLASQLMLINSTITNTNGAIKIYTDNTEQTANPRFVDPTPASAIDPVSNPAGLVLVDGTGTGGATLPLAWAIKNATTTITAVDPNLNGVCGRPQNANAFQWLFMLDEATPPIDRNGNGSTADTAIPANCPNPDTLGFTAPDSETFATIIDFRGLHFGQSPTEFGGGAGFKTSYVFVSADFSTSLPQQTYRTNKLTVESFIK